jgi:trehalose 6-phosphate phosphatase
MAEKSWALFLDLDGTLLDIAARPVDVVVPEGLLASLAAAREELNGALAIVTGRSIADLDAIIRPLRLAAAGQHGAELRRSPGAAVLKFPSEPIDEDIRHAVTELAEAHCGVALEDKGQSLAIHYRANPAAGEPLRRRIAAILAAASHEKLVLTSGKMVLEIRDPRFTKAGAVDALMGDPVFAGRIPTFIGDDETDKDGMAAAERRGGLGLRVGQDGAFARPADLRAWLADLPERLAGSGWP